MRHSDSTNSGMGKEFRHGPTCRGVDQREGVRWLQGRWLGLDWGRWEVGGRSSVAALAPMAVCGTCDGGDGERIRSRVLSRTGWCRFVGTLGQLQDGRQAGSGMARCRAMA